MEEDITHIEEATSDEQGLPPSYTNQQNGSAREENDRGVAAEHFNLVPPAAPLQSISFAVRSTGQTAATLSGIELKNSSDLLA